MLCLVDLLKSDSISLVVKYTNRWGAGPVCSQHIDAGLSTDTDTEVMVPILKNSVFS